MMFGHNLWRCILPNGKSFYAFGVKQNNKKKISEDDYEKWNAENKKMKRWLLKSMSPEIMKHYLHLPTA